MFKEKLYEVLRDLDNHKHCASVVLRDSIQSRLDASLDVYIKSLKYSERVVSEKDALKVLRQLNRSR